MSQTYKVSRTLGPWGAGLAVYDATGKILGVLPVETKSKARWIRQSVTRDDRQRAIEAIVKGVE